MTTSDRVMYNELLVLHRKLQACELKCNILEERVAMLHAAGGGGLGGLGSVGGPVGGAPRDVIENLRREVVHSVNGAFNRVLNG